MKKKPIIVVKTFKGKGEGKWFGSITIPWGGY
jgi:hypothetical protein